MQTKLGKCPIVQAKNVFQSKLLSIMLPVNFYSGIHVCAGPDHIIQIWLKVAKSSAEVLLEQLHSINCSCKHSFVLGLFDSETAGTIDYYEKWNSFYLHHVEVNITFTTQYTISIESRNIRDSS